MIMAAGYGNRMGELTRELPKPLLPLTPQLTILDTVVAKLVRSGIERIVINCHYQAEKIRAHFRWRTPEKAEIIFSDEPVLLGSGGGIGRAEPYFEGETILVTNADVLCTVDIRDLFRRHIEAGAVASMNILPSRNADAYTLVRYDEEHRIGGFLPLHAPIPDEGGTGIFTGHQILSPEARQHLGDQPMSVIDRVYKRGIAVGETLLAATFSGEWIDIGNRDFYEDFCKKIASREIDLNRYMR